MPSVCSVNYRVGRLNFRTVRNYRVGRLNFRTVRNYRVGRLNFRTVRPAGAAVNVFVSAATVVGMPAAGS